ncbi:MAG: RAMP superfamily CRISPR-associated protein [Acidobacteriota bacterium]
MRYRVTCLSPTLVGDGNKLAPIDYMVWKDHLNVLNQQRIFKLLSKGPRLEGYLQQLKTADKLDFASWGGFAQNFAGRRIPFEHASVAPIFEKTPSENLFVPTFATSGTGPYLPATALKGALRTGSVFDRWVNPKTEEGVLKELAEKSKESRLPRNSAVKAEEIVLGSGGRNLMRRVGAGDSHPTTYAGMKVYLLRTSTLIARGAGKYELGWKSARGTAEAKRIDDSTPVFAEMASPGVTFDGIWQEQSERDRERVFQASNKFAAMQLARHKEYAQWTGLAPLQATVEGLESKLNALGKGACLLSLGWGGGMLSKVSASLSSGDDAEANSRTILKQAALYQKALATGLPFPKTRRIVFEGGKAAQIPGWVLLELV